MVSMGTAVIIYSFEVAVSLLFCLSGRVNVALL
jgi:hypothetical protein